MDMSKKDLIEAYKIANKEWDKVRGHKIITKAEIKKIPAIGATRNEKDPIVWVRIFHPYHQMTWYIIEIDPETGEAFGYVDGPFPELGHFNVWELGASHIKGLMMERDRFFKPCRLSEIKRR